MCLCKKLIISFVFCAICCTNVILSVPNAWPKMRNYDIWGSQSTKHTPSDDNYYIENVTSSRDSRVLNFFPVPVDDECLSDDGRRSGVCLNVYECRIQGGSSRGQCALGFGVCCVFYYDVPGSDAMGRQEVDDIEIFMNFTDRFSATRLWEIRVAQIPFSQRAPSGCLQYFTSRNGIIQTFNFAENGRHLANQNYRSCVRQEVGMCSIAYEPCTEQSFRIGQRNPLNMDNMQDLQNVNMGMIGSGANPMMTATAQMPVQNVAADQTQAVPVSESPVQTASETVPTQDQQVAADESTADDVVEGSGGGDIPAVAPAPTRNSFFSSLSSFQSFFSRRFFNTRQSRQYFSQCNDRITMPCIVEDFIAAGMGNVPDCTPIHCGNSLCAPGVLPCRVESTVTPFGLGIRFGDGSDKGSPEDNIGACLRFNQVNCV